MRHARADYNRFQDPENKIPDDEPVFLLRAQDRCAAKVVRFWAQFNKDSGGDHALSEQVMEWAIEFDKWPVKKHADLPEEKP